METGDESGSKSADRCERLSESSLLIGKYDGIMATHSGVDMIPGDFVINGFILGPGDEFIEIESRGTGLEDFEY